MKNWKLKIIINHFLSLLNLKYRFVFYFDGNSPESNLKDIKFEKYRTYDLH